MDVPDEQTPRQVPPREGVSPRAVEKSLREYGRGIAGGLLFSLPLLYTMEIWEEGVLARPEALLLYLLATFVLLLGYNRYGGFRQDVNWAEVFTDSVEELGLGLLISTVVLFLTGRITPDTSWREAVGMVAVEASIVAIGVSVGTAQLGGDDSPRREDQRNKAERVPGQLIIGFCGAVLFASNVAPTDEIQVIAVESSPGKLLGIALLSLVLGGLILYQLDFTRARRLTHRVKAWDMLWGTVVTYALALASSTLVLWFFGRFPETGLFVCVAEVVVLSLAGTLGASAGRLLIQS
mgnify:CR=1 FL=1